MWYVCSKSMICAQGCGYMCSRRYGLKDVGICALEGMCARMWVYVL
jgi:hypothetical protein